MNDPNANKRKPAAVPPGAIPSVSSPGVVQPVPSASGHSAGLPPGETKGREGTTLSGPAVNTDRDELPLARRTPAGMIEGDVSAGSPVDDANGGAVEEPGDMPNDVHTLKGVERTYAQLDAGENENVKDEDTRKPNRLDKNGGSEADE